jgi:hypothetical protein
MELTVPSLPLSKIRACHKAKTNSPNGHPVSWNHRRPATGNQQPATGHRQPATSNGQPATGHR